MLAALFEGFISTVKDVSLALTPVLIIFLLAQVFLLRLPVRRLRRLAKGFIIGFIGLVLFLQGVNVGFIPIGEKIGISLGSLVNNWIVIPIGFILGFVTVMAEPTVRVLTDEIERVSGGAINKTILLFTLCIGVAASVALAMAKILLGIPLWYFILPGYVVAFILSRYADPKFIAMAFDSGGVATGPMTVTFILSITVGLAKVLENRDPLIDGFGTVALVYLTPVLAVLLLGFLYTRKEQEQNK
ncbi:MAG: DUF1538 domain-containing protein [Desulfitobacteriia bacterium]|jgi:hypothetical protein